MTQALNYSVPRIGPAAPTEFAGRADDSFDSLLSGHSGAARPAYAVAGTRWVSTATAGSLKYYEYDGTSDHLIMTINLTTGKIIYGDGTLADGVQHKSVYAAKNATYTAVAADDNGVGRFTAAANLNLSAANTLGANWSYTVVADGGDVTIDPNGSQTINGQTTLVVKNGTSCKIICDGSNFFAIIRTGVWETLGVYTLSAASTFVLTNLDDAKFLRLTGVIDSMSAAGLLTMQVSSNGGSTYDTGTNYYSQAWSATSATLAAGSLPAAASFPLSSQGSVDVGTPVPFEAILSNFNKAARLNGFVRAFVSAGGAGYAQNMANFHLPSTARNALKIFNSGSGTMTGVIVVEKIRG